MKRNLLLLAGLAFCLSGFAQQLTQSNAYEFSSLKKDTYLGDVSYNEETGQTEVVYVENDMFQTSFVTYRFDENLNFLNEEKETITMGQELAADLRASLQQMYPWFEYRGDSYSRNHMSVVQNMRGEIVVYSTPVVYKWNWNLGMYLQSFGKSEKIKLQGNVGEKLFIYDQIPDVESESLYLIIGVKAPKGSGDKYQHARKFQIVHIPASLEAEYLEELNFEYNMAISFRRVIKNDDCYAHDYDADISNGKLVLVFSPIKTMFGKDFVSPNPQNHQFVVMDDQGQIEMNLPLQSEVSGWLIEDVIRSFDGRDYYLYGNAKEKKYVNQLMPVISPLNNIEEPADIKWKHFQVCKISDGQLAFVKANHLDLFEEKFVAPASQKAKVIYKGRKFERMGAMVTMDGELLITGQKYTLATIPDPNNPDLTITVPDNYKDLILFHFDNSGNLKAQYGVRRDKNNQWAKANPTPQDLFLSSDGKTLNWVYGEIKGMKHGFEVTGGILELTGNSSLSKRKLLFYPTVARIDLETAEIGEFVSFGQEDGKQMYYTNPIFPYLYDQNTNSLTFIGEDKKGKLMWLARMPLQ